MSDWGPSDAGGTVTDERAAASEAEVWAYVPVTVVGVVTAGGLCTVAGVRPFTARAPGLLGSVLGLLSAVSRHVLSLFVHEGLWHFLGNSFMLVLFGGALTLLSSNRHVLGVVAVSHVGWSVLRFQFTGATGIGSSLALAGVIAATVVRSTAVVAGVVPSDRVERLFGGWFALFVTGCFVLMGATGAYYLRVFDHHVGGWALGATAELAWVGWLSRRGG